MSSPEATFTILDGGAPRVQFVPEGRTQAGEQAAIQRASQAAEQGGVIVSHYGNNVTSINMATDGAVQAGAPITSATRNGFNIGNASELRPGDVVTIAGISMSLKSAEAAGLVTRGGDGQWRAAGEPSHPKP